MEVFPKRKPNANCRRVYFFKEWKSKKPKYLLLDVRIQGKFRAGYYGRAKFGNGFPNVARVLQYMDAVAHQLYDVKH